MNVVTIQYIWRAIQESERSDDLPFIDAVSRSTQRQCGGSLLWELHANRRTCAERSIKRKKLDCGLDHTRIAGRERWFFRVTLAAMCQHLDAWSTHLADH